MVVLVGYKYYFYIISIKSVILNFFLMKMFFFLGNHYGGNGHHLISPTLSQKEVTLRYRSTNEHPVSALRDPVRRVPSHNSSHSSLPQRYLI